MGYGVSMSSIALSNTVMIYLMYISDSRERKITKQRRTKFIEKHAGILL